VATHPANERPYLSIGEVLGLLLEDFPDVSISKIRFLESQGLIVPERTASGYRKFYDEDVERLRFILGEQKDHFLPLRIIKDRLDTPPSGTSRPNKNERPQPRGIKNVGNAQEDLEQDISTDSGDASNHDVAKHPAARTAKVTPQQTARKSARPALPDPSDAVGRPATYTRAELLQLSDLQEAVLVELESFHMVTAHQTGSQALYDEHDLAIAEVARAFTEAGVDVRHLKAWKTAAEREAGLFEQRVLPLLRRRSPESRQESNELLDDLVDLGARLRAILVARAVGNLRDTRSGEQR